MRKINIAIDGYSACGKSSTAKVVAKQLNYIYIDSGAMYRAVTYYFIQHNINLNNSKEVADALKEITITFNEQNRIFLNNEDVSDAIRQSSINQLVSEVAAISDVRKKMVQLQQAIVLNKGVVMDGRDIASVVMPNAELKIFMTASIDIRTQRRLLELNLENSIENFEATKRNLLHRDHIDSTRADSPLIQVEDAIVIDTSYLDFSEQVQQIIDEAQKIIQNNN